MKQKETILSLDTATTTGYSIYKNNEIKYSGVWKFSKNDKTKKLIQFYETLCKTIEKYHISTVVAEDIFFDEGKPKALLALGAMRGIIQLVCAQYQIKLADFIEPVDHKYLLTGNLYANKSQTVKAINELGYQVKDDNEADAISIMLAHLQLNKLPIIHPVQA